MRFPQFDCFATIACLGHNCHVSLSSNCRSQTFEDECMIVGN
jgi:hypothetical protein